MESPLVTIVVLCYNSSNTIIETLESIYNQTYQNIELIISDDFSLDESVLIAQNWLSEKNSRFVDSHTLTSHKNEGISANSVIKKSTPACNDNTKRTVTYNNKKKKILK